MDLFKLVGTIAIKNQEANKSIDDTTEKGEQAQGKLTTAFERIGQSFSKMFNNNKSNDVKKSFDDLTSTTDKQKEKLESLKAEYRNLYTQHGKNSNEAKEVAEKIKELSAEIDKNEKEMEEASKAADSYDKSLDKVGDGAEKSKSKLGSVFSGIGKGAVAVGKTMATGLAVGGAAVVGLATKSIQSYADYEQLVGGVETLFKDSSQKVQQYAKGAYKSAGLSANEYMDTVTSFSASLLQSLGGNTAKAADMSDMAITDMADNANKMGTDMSLIQTAYQGFAKKNYSMLDNLKLGYGGTQKEMARLLEDASKLDENFNPEFHIDSKGHLEAEFADVVQAIHIVQDEMGITGTTTKEAGSTISGSISSMKSAWQNLLTAISSDELPFDDYVNGFVDSVVTVGKNLLPRVGIVLDGVVTLIEKLAPKIIAELPNLLSQLLPAVINAATGLITAIVSVIPSLVDAIVDALPMFINGIVKIFNAIVEALPTLITTLVSALPTLIPQLINGLVTMIVTLCNNFSQIIQPLIDYLPKIIIAIVEAIVNNLPQLIQGLITLIMGIVEAIPQIIIALVDAIPTIISLLIQAILGNLPAIIVGLIKVVMGIVKAIPQIFGSLIKGIVNIFKGIWDGLGKIFGKIGSWFKEKFSQAAKNIKNAFSSIGTFFSNIWSKITSVFSNVGTWFKEKFTTAKNGITNAWSKVTSFFSNIKNGIVNAFSNVKEKMSAPFIKARDLIKGVVDKVKGFFSGLKLNFPKIKLPHFGLSPKGWKIDDLLKGKIPKLKIDWYAKAMKRPMLLDDPTIFGYDAKSNSLMGGGEAGAEVVSGANTLMGMIRNAVASENGATTYYLKQIILILSDYFPQLLEACGHDILLNDGVLVGRLAPKMNKQLGIIAKDDNRGR